MSGVKVSACVCMVDQRVISEKEHVWIESKCMCVYVVDQRAISEKEHVWMARIISVAGGVSFCPVWQVVR